MKNIGAKTAALRRRVQVVVDLPYVPKSVLTVHFFETISADRTPARRSAVEYKSRSISRTGRAPRDSGADIGECPRTSLSCHII